MVLFQFDVGEATPEFVFVCAIYVVMIALGAALSFPFLYL